MTPSTSTNDGSQSNDSDRLDKIGGLASTACAIHCLIAPVLFLTLPAFAEIWAHPASHALMAIWVVPMALTVVIHGYRKHRQKWVSAAALVGIACILTGSALPYLPAGSDTLTVDSLDADSLDANSLDAVAMTTEESCDCCPSLVTDQSGDMSLHWPPAGIATVMGSGFLIVAHWGNRRCGRRCCESETGTCQNRVS
ncbi:MAG: MerC domain-containing protein [Planctomycetota bacterium]